MAEKTALVLGALDPVGNHCLTLLLQSSCYAKVIALVRSSLTMQHPKLVQDITDFNLNSNLEKYYVGVDEVFCCLGTNLKEAGSQSLFRRIDFHIPTEAAHIAHGHGVKQFLAISAKGADNHSSDLYLRTKGEMEKGLAQFDFPSLHIFRPPMVTSPNDNDRPGGFFQRLFNSKSDNLDEIAISAETIAKAMVHVAEAENKGRHYYGASQIMKFSEMNLPCHKG